MAVKIDNLRAYYRSSEAGVSTVVRAVDGVNLTIRDNEIFGIAGESSCGKTTLIRTLSGTIKPPLEIMGGRVLYDVDEKEVDLFSLRSSEVRALRWKHVAYILQGSMSVLNPVRRVIKTFEDFTEAHERIKDKKAFREKVNQHVLDLGLPIDVVTAFPHQLSGGMRQRVAIALATIFKPPVILADEPTTALDVVVQRGVLQLLKDIQRETGNTVVLVTHDMAVHANVADRVGIMYAGRIVEVGSVDDIFHKARHPYTQHLIGSLPTIGDKTTRSALPGAPPSLATPPEGCRFHPRCEYAMDICRRDVPPMLEAENGHQTACFWANKEAVS